MSNTVVSDMVKFRRDSPTGPSGMVWDDASASYDASMALMAPIADVDDVSQLTSHDSAEEDSLGKPCNNCMQNNKVDLHLFVHLFAHLFAHFVSRAS